MNRIFILLSIFCLVSCVKPEPKPPLLIHKKLPQKVVSSAAFSDSYILGSWKMKSVDITEEDAAMPQKGEITFFPTGQFKANTLMRFCSKKLNDDIFSFSTIEAGTWKTENNKLVLTYKVREVDKLNTKEGIPPVLMKMFLGVFKNQAKRSIGELSVYSVRSQKKNSVNLFSKEDDTLYQYTRK